MADRVAEQDHHGREVIRGAGRHWAVSRLRGHGLPELRLLVDPRGLSDQEAFRLAGVENRSPQDLGDHERATDHARALERRGRRPG